MAEAIYLTTAQILAIPETFLLGEESPENRSNEYKIEATLQDGDTVYVRRSGVSDPGPGAFIERDGTVTVIGID